MSATLAKGQNSPLAAADVVITVRVAASADLSALLVTAHGKVRSDADFIFFNQPRGPGVNLRLGPAGQPSALAVSLGAVPADIDQIRAVIALDDPATTFGRIPAPVAVVADAGGNTLYEYRIEGLSTESIVIAVELYRRQNSWKVRAVGQGYAGGFAALVTDHGVSVEDAPPPASASTTPSPMVTPARATSPVPTYPPPNSPVYPAQPPPQYSPAVSYASPPGPGYLPAAPGYPSVPAPGYPTGSAGQGYPHAVPRPTPPPAEEVSLAKGRPVSLAKGQRVTLRKEGGVALTYVRMGLGWDPVKKGGLFGGRTINVDLDASVALFAERNLVDVAYYGQLTSKDGSIRHQGDNLTGEGEGDDEVILVDLTRVPAHVSTCCSL